MLTFYIQTMYIKSTVSDSAGIHSTVNVRNKSFLTCLVCKLYETIYSPENKKKKDLIDTLVRRGYDSDPVKAWKEAQNKGKVRRIQTSNWQASDISLD